MGNSSSSKMSTPAAFLCPITKEVMREPVIDRDGNTFERSAIVQWLEEHGTSPITRNPMSASDLVPNRELKQLIEQADGANANGGQRQPAVVPPTAPRQAVPLPTNEVVRVQAQKQGDRIWVRLEPEASQTRSPVDLVCVIDISGSMGTEAVIKTEAGVENNGLSILDVVKHALRTIIASLGPNDTLSLVTFESRARILRTRVPTTDDNKPGLIQSVDSMRPMDMTNLWDGMKKGLGIFAGNSGNNAEQRVPSMFILTDGQPNVAPPRGHAEAFKRYTAEHGVRCTVNTFGFGYNLDSELLYELATLGDGLFSFIPDAGMVGTVFVHALANTCATMSTDVSVQVGDRAAERIGTLQYGQTRDVVVEGISLPDDDSVLQIKVSHVPWWTTDKTTVQVNVGPVVDANEMEYQHLRQRAAKALVAKDRDTIQVVLSERQAAAPSADADKRIVDLLTDLSGQGLLACDPTHFGRWGKHYLPSLGRSHVLQQCNNFKDPGVQHYGGALFNTLRDTMDRIFDDLPPAVPSRREYVDPRTNTVRMSVPVSMSSYNRASDPCFGGACRMRMADGTLKRVEDLVKGDVVGTEDGASAKIVCVVKTIPRHPAPRVQLGGLLITPWHPVKHQGKWVFPHDICGTENHVEDQQPVYSLVLEDKHTVVVEDWICVTLGHAFHTDPVCSHPFFAGSAVTECLQSMDGYEDGFVLTSGVVRHPETGLVCGFAPVK